MMCELGPLRRLLCGFRVQGLGLRVNLSLKFLVPLLCIKSPFHSFGAETEVPKSKH